MCGSSVDSRQWTEQVFGFGFVWVVAEVLEPLLLCGWQRLDLNVKLIGGAEPACSSIDPAVQTKKSAPLLFHPRFAVFTLLFCSLLLLYSVLPILFAHFLSFHPLIPSFLSVPRRVAKANSYSVIGRKATLKTKEKTHHETPHKYRIERRVASINIWVSLISHKMSQELQMQSGHFEPLTVPQKWISSVYSWSECRLMMCVTLPSSSSPPGHTCLLRSLMSLIGL